MPESCSSRVTRQYSRITIGDLHVGMYMYIETDNHFDHESVLLHDKEAYPTWHDTSSMILWD